jgi:hypothetical protein
MSKWLLAAAIPLSIVSIYLAARQIAEGSFPSSLTTPFLMAAVILEQPALKRTLGWKGALLSRSCIGIALAIVAVQVARLGT